MLFIKSDVLLKKDFHLLFLALESLVSRASLSYLGSSWKPTLFSKISVLFLSHLHVFLFDSFFVFLLDVFLLLVFFCLLYSVFPSLCPSFCFLFLPSVFVWCRVLASKMAESACCIWTCNINSVGRPV